MRRISEYPLECGPLDAMPTRMSPARTLLPSSSFDFSTAPTVNPARSYSPGGYMSGISAVSPPINAHPDSSQPFAMPADDGDGRVDVELSGGEVIEEEQRLGALDEDVVDAHADQVDADRVVAAELLGKLELRAHAVGAGDQYRFTVLVGQVEQGAESAEPAHHLRPETAPHQRLDALDDGVARIDVDTGIAVSHRAGRCGGFGDCSRVSRQRARAAPSR
jgi:hypothetical protein